MKEAITNQNCFLILMADYECSLFGLLEAKDHELLLTRLHSICGEKHTEKVFDRIYSQTTTTTEGQVDDLIMRVREVHERNNKPPTSTAWRVMHYGRPEPYGKHPTTVRTATCFPVKDSCILNWFESIGFKLISEISMLIESFAFQDFVVEIIQLEMNKEISEDYYLVYARASGIAQEMVPPVGLELLRFGTFLNGLVHLRPVDHHWLLQKSMH